MYYYLYNTVKHDTGIKGYWKDSQGKIFIDDINIIKCHKKALKSLKKSLFNSGELAVIYRIGKKAIIENRDKSIIRLKKHILFKEPKSLETYQKIKSLVNQYSGCTVYNKKGYLLIEVFTN